MPRSSGTGETSSSGHTTPAPGRKRSGVRSPAPPAKVSTGRDIPSALQRSLQHNNQLRALPRAQPRLRGSTPLAAGEAEGELRLPDRDSQPLVTQGGAAEPRAPPQQS